MPHTPNLTRGATRLVATTLFVALLFAAVIPLYNAGAAPLAATSPILVAAANFSILADTLISDADLLDSTSISGDVGLDGSGASYSGLNTVEVAGTIYANDAAGPDGGTGNNPVLMTSARNDNIAAFGALDTGANADANCISPYTFGGGNVDLVGATLVPGVYCADTFTLTGTLTLSGSGVWVFKSAATLITSGTANVVGGDPCNVWWRVVSSATLGTNTQLTGNILALTSIGLNTGATLNGRAFAQTGAVTLDDNTITRPLCSPTTVTTNLSSSSVTAGSTVFDSATLGGVTGNAGGSVTYTVYTDSTCTLNAQTAGTVTVTNGVVPNSNTILFNSAGTFFWQAVYSGDSNNLGASSVCTTEQLTVNAAVATDSPTSAPPAATSAPPAATNAPAPTATFAPTLAPTATTPAVVGLPNAGGGPSPREDFLWTAILAAVVVGAIALGLSARARRRA